MDELIVTLTSKDGKAVVKVYKEGKDGFCYTLQHRAYKCDGCGKETWTEPNMQKGFTGDWRQQLKMTIEVLDMTEQPGLFS